ncbi:hypothetical protein [Leucobacter sp. wl10]|uniref:hypothetical protein n=1 Tax=Leucobacter sp. wl10 TaxID=2304677 RepID=UPI000E5AF71E|nr:hypothetical protein [Leucobacter sp. wl10]RGE18976.1 hypothetical protein D1J51_13495 [Leucobacter sp. wl10]
MSAGRERRDRGAPGDGGAARTVRRPRRATLPAPEGSDPEPRDPPAEQRGSDENDARLREDRPPHWG